MPSYKEKDPIILVTLTAQHTMHKPYHVITLHESTKEFVILRVRIFTKMKPNFMVTQCVLGKYLIKILPLSNTQQRKQPVSGSGV
jgi:hypothetical protein